MLRIRIAFVTNRADGLATGGSTLWTTRTGSQSGSDTMTVTDAFTAPSSGSSVTLTTRGRASDTVTASDTVAEAYTAGTLDPASGPSGYSVAHGTGGGWASLAAGFSSPSATAGSYLAVSGASHSRTTGESHDYTTSYAPAVGTVGWSTKVASAIESVSFAGTYANLAGTSSDSSVVTVSTSLVSSSTAATDQAGVAPGGQTDWQVATGLSSADYGAGTTTAWGSSAAFESYWGVNGGVPYGTSFPGGRP